MEKDDGTQAGAKNLRKNPNPLTATQIFSIFVHYDFYV
jgi:hypothetical protein